MIEVEGYKMFRGIMLITPKSKDFKPFSLSGDWLYKPEYDCWYGRGQSYPASICKVIKED